MNFNKKKYQKVVRSHPMDLNKVVQPNEPMNELHHKSMRDSMMSSTQVLEVIKSAVTINMAYIDKVIIICSGRIEGAHVEAIKQFMSWLSFEKYKQKFVFIHNKSEGFSEAEKLENIAYMVNTMKGDPSSHSYKLQPNGDKIRISLNLPLGFPKGAAFSDVEKDHKKLIRATLAQFPEQRIPVDKSSCTIL